MVILGIDPGSRKMGYGVVKKSDLTGSVGSVKSDVISARGSTYTAA